MKSANRPARNRDEKERKNHRSPFGMPLERRSNELQRLAAVPSARCEAEERSGEQAQHDQRKRRDEL